MKYNNEEFPGLFVKKDIGTAILFHRGTIVLVGCNSKENLKKLALHVNEKLNSIEIF
jgi:TATA-box binding protein (TBP) (component of TFIID and TFIIIB)